MLEKTYINPKVKMMTSPISGVGLFSLEYIAEGELVIHWWGWIIVTIEEFEQWYKQGKYQTDSAIHYDSKHMWVDLNDSPDYADAAINHSCDPNTWFDNSWRLVARRDISPWEEITFHYATGETYPLHYECKCGSKDCMKYITWKEWQNISFQNKFKQHFNPYIQWLIDNNT